VVARGYSNKEIGSGAPTSAHQTVKNHITSILRKLAVNDRTQAVIYALRHGWIKLEARGQSPWPRPQFRSRARTTLAPAELPLQFLGAQMNHRRAPMRAGVGDAALLELANEFAHLGKREFLSRPDR
jgi:hypothetical protein